VNSEDQYCLDLVRSNDKDRFLASLFAPENKRPHLMALYAFNCEIVRARDLVSEAAIGEIRLQWWMDTLDGIYDGAAQDHPVAIALARAIVEGDLPKHALRNLVNAHIFDFYADPMPTFSDLEGYLGETSSALIQMAALILAGEEALENAEASGLAGVAYGLSGILSSLPKQRALSQCFIPADMLKARDAAPADLIAARNEVALSVVLAELREKARMRLLEARKMSWTIKPAAMPAFLHVALTDGYLNAIAQNADSVLQKGVGVSPWRKQWTLWKAARTEMF
jgi:15-cis-phytoene synthase